MLWSIQLCVIDIFRRVQMYLLLLLLLISRCFAAVGRVVRQIRLGNSQLIGGYSRGEIIGRSVSELGERERAFAIFPLREKPF